jgi:hypothetical protein
LAVCVIDTLLVDSDFIVSDSADLVELFFGNKTARAGTFAEITNGGE